MPAAVRLLNLGWPQLRAGRCSTPYPNVERQISPSSPQPNPDTNMDTKTNTDPDINAIPVTDSDRQPNTDSNPVTYTHTFPVSHSHANTVSICNPKAVGQRGD